MKEEIKYMDQYEIDLNHDDVDGICSLCNIMINEYGQPQCPDCFNLLNLYIDKKYIITCLKEAHGPMWEERYKALQEIQFLLRRKQFDQLYPIEYTYYIEERSKIKQVRIFYEKVRSD
jgi:hypothetical protein